MEARDFGRAVSRLYGFITRSPPASYRTLMPAGRIQGLCFDEGMGNGAMLTSVNVAVGVLFYRKYCECDLRVEGELNG